MTPDRLRLPSFLLLLCFFADYLDAFGPLGQLLKLGITLTLLIQYLPLAVTGFEQLRAFSLVMVLYLTACLFKLTDPGASMYEWTKLFVFIVVITGCTAATFQRPGSSLHRRALRFESHVGDALRAAVFINGILVLVQVLVGNTILVRMGVPAEYFAAPEKAGRYSALILNLPLWSAMLLLVILRSDRGLFGDRAWSLTRGQLLWTYALLLLAGQKYVLLIAVAYNLFRLPPARRLLLLTAVVAVVMVLPLVDNYQVQDRLSQATALMDNGIGEVFSLVDLDAVFPQFQFVDVRLNSWIFSLAHLQSQPEGRGLGTWGDFSSPLNPLVRDPVTLSESYWAHILVEQGWLAVGFIAVCTFIALFVRPPYRKRFAWIGLYLLLAGCFTMGPNDYLWLPVAVLVLAGLPKPPARRVMSVVAPAPAMATPS